MRRAAQAAQRAKNGPAQGFSSVFALMALASCQRTPLDEEQDNAVVSVVVVDTSLNDAPVLTRAIDDIVISENEPFTTQLTLHDYFVDPENNQITFSITTTRATDVCTPEVPCLASDSYNFSTNGALLGIQTFPATIWGSDWVTSGGARLGSGEDAVYLVTVTASDGLLAATDVFRITVTNQNDFPEFTQDAQRIELVNDDASASFAAFADYLFAEKLFDRDSVPYTVTSVENLPSGLTLVHETGTESTPIVGFSGAVSVLGRGSVRTTINIEDAGQAIQYELVLIDTTEQRRVADHIDRTGTIRIAAQADDNQAQASPAIVGAIGDVNNDGYDDIAVLDPTYTGFAGETGRLYILFGDRVLLTESDLSAIALPSADQGLIIEGVAEAFGVLPGDAAAQVGSFRITAAGDTNGDNIDDFFVARGTADTSSAVAGYLFFGNNDLGTLGSVTTTAQQEGEEDQTYDIRVLRLADITDQEGLVITGHQASNGYGSTMQGIGDINGDGFDDFAVAAIPGNIDVSSGEFEATTGANNRYVDIYLGGQFTYDILPNGLPYVNPSATSGVIRLSYGKDGTPGTSSDTDFGLAALSGEVTQLGDINGDGFDDIALGYHLVAEASYDKDGTAQKVDALVQAGGFVLLGRDFSDPVLLREELDTSIVDDLAETGAARVAIDIADLSPLGFHIHADAVVNESSSASYAISNGQVVAAGDINRDGYDDLVFTVINGAPETAEESVSRDGVLSTAGATVGSGGDSGSIYVLFGRNDFALGETTNLAQIAAEDGLTIVPHDPASTADNAGFGRTVIGIGDHNGDGYGDLAIAMAETDGDAANRLAIVFYSEGEFHALGGDFGAITTTTLADLTERRTHLIDLSTDFTYHDGVFFAANDGHASPADQMAAAQDTDFASIIRALGDVDGDGLHDLLFQAPAVDLSGMLGGSHVVLSGDDYFALNQAVVESGFTYAGDSAANILAPALDTSLTAAQLAAGLRIEGNGGRDILLGAPGHDFLVVGDDTFRFVDGSYGDDALFFISTRGNDAFNI
ncbi:MAG: integrin alpha, partial [Alphaproteobacteria bacterium]|nr:integrin alpha [Alphaproteobacteria bacterium]